MDIPQNGELIIESIFALGDGFIEIEPILRRAAKSNCIVYFKNENLRITPENVNSAETRAIISAYSSVILYPKVAVDYLMYKLNK